MGRDESGALVMPINRAITTIFIAILALSLSGCSSASNKGMDHEGHSAGASGELSSDEIMFLQMMIPHHQQAIDISDLALTKRAMWMAP